MVSVLLLKFSQEILLFTDLRLHSALCPSVCTVFGTGETEAVDSSVSPVPGGCESLFLQVINTFKTQFFLHLDTSI